ncbi:MAG: beta-ketoacyl synthase chain length factor [Prevotella sp.]|nr:beta-ketoacyl synthase chain length factor [Prevotella sp.]
MDNRIVITGEGIVCAIGLDKTSVVNSLLHGRSGIGTMKYLASVHKELPVGEVNLSNEEMQAMLGISPTEDPSRTTMMGMLAVRQALDDAKIKERKDNKRIVFVSGTTVGGMDITEKHYGSLKVSDEHLEVLRHHECGSCTRDIADYFGIFDDFTTLSTACSSAANAIVLGAQLIQSGQADIVVAGGTEALSLFHLNGFNSLMILDHERCRPFDATRAGLNLGEGAAYIVMEREDGAQERCADIHAYIAGYGNACDAYHQTASSDDGEGAYLSMRDAITMAGIDEGAIDYVNAHGTGTPNNDLSESVALRRIFGSIMPPISSTKSFTGHTTSASGSIEAVICLLAMRHHFIPPNLGWQHVIEGGVVPSMGAKDVDIQYVLCNAFGFGGNDTSLLFSAGTPLKSLPAINADKPIHVISRVEISDEDDLKELKEYISMMEARRMGRLLKASLLTSLKALRAVGLERPDAIITATAMGCLENSERLLDQLEEEGEASVKPTFFMQSTHNTLGSNIAIRTKCHGWNVTFTHGKASLEWALREAKILLGSGKYKHVLVGFHDESTPQYTALQRRLCLNEKPTVYSLSMVLTCGE